MNECMCVCVCTCMCVYVHVCVRARMHFEFRPIYLYMYVPVYVLYVCVCTDRVQARTVYEHVYLCDWSDGILFYLFPAVAQGRETVLEHGGFPVQSRAPPELVSKSP